MKPFCSILDIEKYTHYQICLLYHAVDFFPIEIYEKEEWFLPMALNSQLYFPLHWLQV